MMFENSRHIYSVKVCPNDDLEGLEALLNSMSEEGWELYMLHEAESKKGGIQYNCIFVKEAEEEFESNEIVDVDNLKTRIEKMLQPSDEPYDECKEIQRRITQKQQEISRIKNLLELTTSGTEHGKLNQEISRNLKELEELKAELSEAIDPDRMFDRINQDKLTIVISDELIDLVDIDKGGDLIAETVNLRQKLADQLGYVIPAIKFTDSEILEANEYKIDVRGLKTVSGVVYPGYVRFQPGQSNINKKPKDAIADIDAITGENVFWIEAEKTKNFWEKGLTPAQVITNSLEYVVCKYVVEILDYSDINNYIDIVSNQNLYLVDNLVPDLLSIGDLRYVFAGLIREKVSVKDLVYIFERLNDFIQQTVEKEILLEKLRISLGRQVCSNIADINNTIYGIVIPDKVAENLEELLVADDERDIFDPKHPKISKMIRKISDIVKNSDYDISNMALVSPSYIRLQLFLLFEQIIPGLSVLSKEELSREYHLEAVEKLSGIL